MDGLDGDGDIIVKKGLICHRTVRPKAFNNYVFFLEASAANVNILDCILPESFPKKQIKSNNFKKLKKKSFTKGWIHNRRVRIPLTFY